MKVLLAVLLLVSTTAQAGEDRKEEIRKIDKELSEIRKAELKRAAEECRDRGRCIKYEALLERERLRLMSEERESLPEAPGRIENQK